VEKKGEGDKPKVEGKLLPAAGLATPAAPPPVIPTSLLAPDEQRRLCIWVIGLIEVSHD
jgi:hypothetical protein